MSVPVIGTQISVVWVGEREPMCLHAIVTRSWPHAYPFAENFEWEATWSRASVVNDRTSVGRIDDDTGEGTLWAYGWDDETKAALMAAHALRTVSPFADGPTGATGSVGAINAALAGPAGAVGAAGPVRLDRLEWGAIWPIGTTGTTGSK